MKVLFDTSVLICAVVDQLPHHESAFAAFVQYSTPPHQACCTTHALAEAYATLTALPLPRRLQPLEAQQLIKANFVARLTILPLPPKAYASALDRVTRLGLASGIIYDALHLGAAETARCDRLLTYNLAHFHRLQPAGVRIESP